MYLSVPYVNSGYTLNKCIYNFNCKLYNLFNTLQDENVFVDLNSLLNDFDKTRGGRHLSYGGRVRLFRIISNLLIEIKYNKYCKTSNLITIHCSDELKNVERGSDDITDSSRPFLVEEC